MQTRYNEEICGIFRIRLIIAGSFKSQLIDYFRGCIVFWEKVEGSIWQFYDN